jgi:YidC/Oxa1 family membrane protein insertase
LEKRLPLFLFLSLLILLAWNLMNPRKPAPRESTGPVAGTDTSPSGAAAPAEIAAFEPVVADAEERRETFFLGSPEGGGYWRLVVSNRGARLVELDLGSYFQRLGLSDAEQADPENWVRIVQAAETQDGRLGSLLLATRPSSADLAPAGLDKVLWAMQVLTDESGAPRGVEWVYDPGRGVRFVKRLTHVPGTYLLRLELELANTGAAAARTTELSLLPAGCMPQELGDNFYDEPRAIAIGYDAEDGEYRSGWESARGAAKESGTLDVPTPLSVAGVHNKYFCFLVFGANDAARAAMAGATYRGLRDEAWLAGNPGSDKAAWRYVVAEISLSLRIPAPGETASLAFDVFAGPKDPDLLEAANPAFSEVSRTDLSGFAIFSTIGAFLLVVLRFLHGLVGNWGVAIILLTICVRVVLFPLNRRSQTAMARYQTKMKRVQPKLSEIKERFAKDPKKLREEQARIMQEERAFPPLGGCLPPFLQIPVFFGLFSALRTAFELRQAPFALWIDDLSRPDQLLAINLHIPIYGDMPYFNLLPILMVVLWVLQQMGMPKPADEQAARMQKMMMVMPVFMGIFLYNYAAGLSLYMITQSGLGIIEQHVIKKLWPLDDTEVEPKKKTAGCGPFAGAMQRLAEKHKAEMERIQKGQPRGGAKTEKKKRRL